MLIVLLVDNSKILCWRIMVSCIFQITLKFVVQKLEIIMCGETISILI